jgi:hypothetical protein
VSDGCALMASLSSSGHGHASNRRRWLSITAAFLQRPHLIWRLSGRRRHRPTPGHVQSDLCALDGRFGVLHRPTRLQTGSDAPSAAFFREFADALDRLETVGGMVILAGDLNVHFERPSNLPLHS